jgi:GNAT superfamily N-acetyltransferase
MEISFRTATASDIHTLVNFMQAYYEYDHIPFDKATASGALEQLLSDNSLGRAWLICLEAKAIGYVVLTFDFSLEYGGRIAYIDEIYIHEDYRGRGAGTQTITFLEKACRSLDLKALYLEVERANLKAQTFYQKMGFVDHDRLLMTKWITQEEG